MQSVFLACVPHLSTQSASLSEANLKNVLNSTWVQTSGKAMNSTVLIQCRRWCSHWGAVLFQCWGHAVQHGEREQWEQHVCSTCDVQRAFSHQSTPWQTTWYRSFQLTVNMLLCAFFFSLAILILSPYLSRHLWHHSRRGLLADVVTDSNSFSMTFCLTVDTESLATWGWDKRPRDSG